MTSALDFELSRLAERRAQVLATQQSLANPQDQMVGGRYISSGLPGLAGALLGKYLGNKQLAEIDTDTQRLQGQKSGEYANGLRKYFSTAEGSPGVPMGPGRQDAEGFEAQAPTENGVTGVVKGNPFRAALEAIGSENAEVKDFGKNALKAALTKVSGAAVGVALSPDVEKLIPHASPESIKRMLVEGAGAFQPKPDVKMTDLLPYFAPAALEKMMQRQYAGFEAKGDVRTVNDQIFADRSGGRSPYALLNNVQSQFNAPGLLAIGADGRPIYGQINRGTGEAKAFPAGGVTVNTGDSGKAAGEREWAKAMSGATVDRLTDSMKKAQLAKQSLTSLDDAASALDAGIVSGAFADERLALAKISGLLGGSTDPDVINTEVYKRQMAEQLFSIIKNFGTGNAVSNTDLATAKTLSGVDTNLDAKSLAYMVKIAHAGALNTLIEHTRLVGSENARRGDDRASSLGVMFNTKSPKGVTMDEKTGLFRPDLIWTVKPKEVKAPAAAASAPTPPGAVSVQDWLSK